MSDRFRGSHAHFDRARKTLAGGVSTAFRATELPLPILLRSPVPVSRARRRRRADADAYQRFAAALLAESVNVIPRGLLYLSAAHTWDDLEATREAAGRAAAYAARA